MHDSQGRDSFTKDTLLSVSDWLLLAQLFTSGEEGLQGQHPRPSACVRQRLHILPSQQRLEEVLFWMGQHELSLQRSHSQEDEILCNWHADSLRGSIISAERGLRRGILSRITNRCIAKQFFYLLLHLNHESNRDQRLWHCQEACASIGARNDDSEQERRSCSSRSLQQPS